MQGNDVRRRFTGTNLVLALLIILVSGAWGASAGMLSRDGSGEGQGAKGDRKVATAAPYEGQSPVEECRLDGVAYQIPVGGTPAGDQGQDAARSQAAPTSAAATLPAADGDFVLPESDTRYYSRDELEGLGKEQLYLARNEIYARLGRKFKNPDLDRYFRSKTWYQPLYEPGSFDAKGDGVFNQYELANRNLIVEIENGMR